MSVTKASCARTSGPTINLDTAPETAPAMPESSAAERPEVCLLVDVVAGRPPILHSEDASVAKE